MLPWIILVFCLSFPSTSELRQTGGNKVLENNSNNNSKDGVPYPTESTMVYRSTTVIERAELARDWKGTTYWSAGKWITHNYTVDLRVTTTWQYEGEESIETIDDDQRIETESPKRKILLWTTNERIFNVLQYQTLLCGDPSSCAAPFSAKNKPHTCCFCSCADDCYAEGSCCLAMYQNITHMQTDQQNSRYKCMETKLLHTVDTSDYLYPRMEHHDITTRLVSHCDPGYVDVDPDTVLLCEGNIKRPQLDSVVPVTEPFINTHYKNKYCAYCNGVRKTAYLISWQFLIYSNQYISKSTKDIISTVTETRGNMFFFPPAFVKVRRCFTSYTIGTCNVTGVWDRYDKDFVTACETYFDPYIHRDGTIYKNYFCYHCNNADHNRTEIEDMSCPLLGVEKDPVFSTIFDLSSLGMLETQNNGLHCNNQQFEDTKLRRCHDVKCYTDQALEYGECKLSNGKTTSQCFSVLFKLMPMKNQARFTHILRTDTLMLTRSIRQILTRDTDLLSTSTEFLYFIQENRRGYIEYVFVDVLFTFVSVSEKIRAVDRLIGTPSIYFESLERGDISFELELVKSAYHLSISDTSLPNTVVELRVSTASKNGVNTFKQQFNSSELLTAECLANQAVPITRLHRCPFVSIPLSALYIKIINGILWVYNDSAHSNILKDLPKWEYEINNGAVMLCYDDYLDIYTGLPMKKSGQSCMQAFTVNPVFMFMIIAKLT